MNPASSPKSLLGLEVLRFGCALAVLVWHYQHFFYVGPAPVGFVPHEQPLYALFKPFYLNGFLGVQAFWAVSGFVFFWKYAQPVAQGQVEGWRFAVLRFSRLYPLHLLTLLVVALLAMVYRAQVGVDYVYPAHELGQFGLQLLMASDWAWQGWSFNGPIWSVSIEILVYALFFALCRIGWTRLWQVALAMGAAGLVYALKLTAHPLVLCVFFFYLGGLTHLAHQALLTWPPARQRLAHGLAAGLLAAATVLVSTGLLRPMFYVALLTPLTTLLLLDRVQPRSARVAGWVTLLGNTTYASYLLHFPLQLGVAVLTAGRPALLPLHNPGWLIGFLVVVFGLAALVYRWVEVPAQNWLRQRLVSGALKAAPAQR